MIGARGARTRQAIIDAALEIFGEKGFNNTLIDDVASAVGISRAGLYQYFESKEQLFVELLHDSGADLMRVVRRLRPLGPTAEGYENLHWWLDDWAWVHDRYSTMFVQWAIVDSPKAPLRPLIGQFIESYAEQMSQRISEFDGAAGLDPDEIAVALLAVVIRYNFYRHTGVDRGLDDDVLLDALATFVQLVLFPGTPPEAFDVDTGGRAGHPRRGRAAAPADAAPTGRGYGRSVPLGDPDRGVPATARRLLDAGAVVFADHGFHNASVDEVLSEAGLGRGTFYKYFRDKLHLLEILAEECRGQLEELVSRFGAAVADRRALREWLSEFVGLHRRYAGVFRAWSEREPRDEVVAEPGVAVATTILRTFDGVLSDVERRYPFDVRAGSLLLLAMLERVPDYAFGTTFDMGPDRIVEVVATLIERGLLGRGHEPVAGLGSDAAGA